MINFVRTFFSPNQSIYLYNSSKELIVSKLNDVLNRKWNLFDSNNLEGEFIHKETFEIRMKSSGYKTGLIGSSSMIGDIKETNDGQTEINLKVKPYFGLYILFFIFIVFSVVYLFDSLNACSIKYALLSCIMLIGGPLLCIWISNIQIAVIKENYVKYIDTLLRAI
ncbi:MAG: hypothetical protein R2852_09530 [Bacteroidia bacterium]